jgi:hypothetical protein
MRTPLHRSQTGHVSGVPLAEQAGIARISNASNLGSRFRHTRLTALDKRASFSGRVTAIRSARHCLRIFWTASCGAIDPNARPLGSVVDNRMRPKVRFAPALLEGDGFGPSVPGQESRRFEPASVPSRGGRCRRGGYGPGGDRRPDRAVEIADPPMVRFGVSAGKSKKTLSTSGSFEGDR